MSNIITPGRVWALAGKDVKASAEAACADPSINGVYKRRTGGITFYDASGEPFGFLVTNRHGERFFVTCSDKAGKIYYMFSTCTITERRLGIEGMGLRDQRELADQIVDKLDSEKAVAVMKKHNVTLLEFVAMSNGEENSTDQKEAFYAAGLTADPVGILDDGYVLNTRIARVMLYDLGFEILDGKWVLTVSEAA